MSLAVSVIVYSSNELTIPFRECRDSAGKSVSFDKSSTPNGGTIMRKLISFSILGMFVFLPMQTIQAEMEMAFSCHNETTFGINVWNNAPGTNSIYIYGPTNGSAWLDAYSGTSLGPFDAGSYTIVMYGNSSTGSHTYTFNNQSNTNSNGWAQFSTGTLPTESYCNSFASITWNGP